MLNLAEHEIFPAHKCFMPTVTTVVSILTFMGRKNSFLGLSEPEKKTEILHIFILMSISNSMLS